MAEGRLKHYSPITGRLEICNSKQGKCPYGAHFIDDVKGQAYADRMNEKNAEREKYLETKEPTYAPRKESLMNEISFSIEDNLDDSQDNFINEQITKRKEFEKRIRDIQNGKEERKVIDDPDGYSVSVLTNLKEKEIEFYAKRADNIAMERYLRSITAGYDSADNENEDEYLTKEVLKKRLDAEKTHIGNSMTSNLKKLLNNDGNPIVFSNNTKIEGNHLDKNDKNAVSIEAVRNLNTISKALKSMGYDNNMPKMADMTLSTERIRLKRDGFENEQMKVTVQKNGAMKIKFKNKDAVHAMNRFSKDLLNESDYEIKDDNPIKDKNDYNEILKKNKNNKDKNIEKDKDNNKLEENSQADNKVPETKKLDEKFVEKSYDDFNFTENELAYLNNLGVTAVGDSVIINADSYIRKYIPNFYLDGEVGRDMVSGPDILSSIKNNYGLADIVLISLGSNGSASEADLEKIMQIADGRDVYFINTSHTQSYMDVVNKSLASFTEKNDKAHLVDWREFVKDRPDLLAPDRTHPNVEGSDDFAKLIMRKILNVNKVAE